jgi:hypothetical protein
LIKTIKIENKKIKILAMHSICEINDIEESFKNYQIDALIHKNLLHNCLYDAYKNLNITAEDIL